MTDQTPATSPSPQAVAEAMFAKDTAAQHHGMVLEAIDFGFAQMSMRILPTMLNGHHITHGGFVFMLADTAFAYACNSFNQNTVASGCSIEFLAASGPGDTLTASAKQVALQGRTGIYDIEVKDQNAQLIAVFRGKSATIKGTHL